MLSWRMPNGERKRVFIPVEPTVSHRVSAGTPCHTRLSAGRPATRRKGRPLSETPAKKFKADEVCQTIPCFMDEKMVSDAKMS